MNSPDSTPDPQKRPSSEDLAELLNLFHTRPDRAVEVFASYYQERIFRRLYWAAIKPSEYKGLYRCIFILVMFHARNLDDPEKLPGLVLHWTRKRIRSFLKEQFDLEPKTDAMARLEALIQLLQNATDIELFALVREKPFVFRSICRRKKHT